MLLPPLLRRLGLRKKISLGPATAPAFRLLQTARHLRGTPFDPFGYARMRRTERALVTEYLRLVGQALTHLTPDTAAAVTEVAGLPELVRGYEGVKKEGIDRFRSESALRLGALSEANRPAVRWA
jgi:indolepyruvate ferredoxin oxidoreductase